MLEAKLARYEGALKESQTMCIELLRTMDEEHWYAPDLTNLLTKVTQVLDGK